ncbi:MAG TPA: hypothetical protein VJ746_10855 [Nitrospira sp.]|nr:hypothetical protein [Nitrospira sp.]
MLAKQSPEELKKFRKMSWCYQQTFATPLKKLSPFIETITCVSTALRGGTVIIDQAIFEPRHLLALLASHSLNQEYQSGVCITASGLQETQSLLQAALSDWIDFAFVSTPRSFAIYADHDEYITFLADTKSDLNGVVKALLQDGFRSIEGYEEISPTNRCSLTAQLDRGGRC